MKKTFFLLVLFIFFEFLLFGQARLNISSGSSVPFYFNSYQKIANGITYTDYTKLSVTYNDTTALHTFPHWRLDVKALNPTIDGDGGNTLNLDILELSATGAGITTGIRPLTTVDDALLTGAIETGAGTATVLITYYCGVTNILLGKNPDLYVIDILFTLMGEN